MKTETCKLYSRVFWILSAKFHQSWSLQLWAIPFQSLCIFETQYICSRTSNV